MLRTTLAIASVFICLSTLLAQEDSTQAEDTSAGLPEQYADFLIASASLSPDKKIAVIYPKMTVCTDEPENGTENRCKDYLVALQPFQILTALETKWPDFQNKNHGGMTVVWSKDGTAVLVTLDSKWGPGDIFLYEIRDGKLTRSTNLLGKVDALLVPDFKKSKADPYNDNFDFTFVVEETPLCQFADSTHVRIRGTATTDPKDIPGIKAWDGAVEATWDIPQAKFTSQKVTRKFAGVRKGSDDQ